MRLVKHNNKTQDRKLTVTRAAEILGVSRTHLSLVLNGRERSESLLRRYAELKVKEEGGKQSPGAKVNRLRTMRLRRALLVTALEELTHAIRRREAVLKLREDFGGLVDLASAFREEEGLPGCTCFQLATQGSRVVNTFLETQQLSLWPRIRDAAELLRLVNPEAAKALATLPSDPVMQAKQACRYIATALLEL